MKTMQKTFAPSLTVLFLGFAFSQVNVGTMAATQAVANAAITTNPVKIKPVVNATTKSKKASVSTIANTGSAIADVVEFASA